MQQLLLIFHLVIALLLIALVMLQQGKGAEMGAAFGSGASGTVFGAGGSASFLTKMTGLLVLLFFVSSLGLGFLVTRAYQHAHGLHFKVSDPTLISHPVEPVKSKS